MIHNRHGSAVIEFPNDLEIVITREFDAPMELVFDVFTKPEHVRKTFAPFGEEVTKCEIDLREDGDYHIVLSPMMARSARSEARTWRLSPLTAPSRRGTSTGGPMRTPSRQWICRNPMG